MSNTPDDAVIERRLLDLAYTTEVKITASALAYFAPCAIEDAARVLEALAARDRVHMDVDDDGTVVYRVPGREKLVAPHALIAHRPGPAPFRAVGPLIAAALTICVPGAGHLYAGRVLAAVMWFFVVSAGYVLILPGLILHLVSIASAANAARQHSASRAPLALAV